MRKIGTTITTCVALLMISSTSIEAQQTNPIFSGGGIRTGQPAKSLQGNNRAIDFSQLGSANQKADTPRLFNMPKWEMPKFQPPKINWPKWMQGNRQNTEGRSLLDGVTQNGVFGVRDPSQPSFFERLNMRTKEIFGRGKSGLGDSMQQARGKTFDSWNSLTRGNSMSGNALSGNTMSQGPISGNAMQRSASTSENPLFKTLGNATAPMQPQLRQAERMNIKPQVRY